MTTFRPTLDQVLAPRRTNRFMSLILILGIIASLAAAAMAVRLNAQKDTILLALRPIPFGQQITEDDLGTVELDRDRPVQLAGITNPATVVGHYAARPIGANDLVQPDMVAATPPDEAVYPNGEVLSENMVAMEFPTASLGPITYRDRFNVGFSAAAGDPSVCRALGGHELAAPSFVVPVTTDQMGQAYTCRLLSRVRILYVDHGAQTLYAELTPNQADVLRALAAAQFPLWGERYGSTSDVLPGAVDLDPSQLDGALLGSPVTTTIQLETLIPERQGMPSR